MRKLVLPAFLTVLAVADPASARLVTFDLIPSHGLNDGTIPSGWASFGWNNFNWVNPDFSN